MINLAGHPEADTHCIDELKAAGITPIVVDRYGEPRTAIAGTLGDIQFRRAWYYWVAKGRVPLDVARRLYADPIGKDDVRVAGFAGNTPPEAPWVEWFDCDERIVVDPDASEEAEYDAVVASGGLDAEDKPRFARTTDGLQGYVTTYHIDSAAGLKLFADAIRRTT